MFTLPALLALASIVSLYSSMLVIFGLPCLFAGGLICVTDLVGATGPFVDGFTENKQIKVEIKAYYPPLMLLFPM